VWPAHTADNLTAICELTVWTIWDPQHLATLQTSMACYMIALFILYVVRFEVFTAVTMKNGVFWVVTPCGSCKNRYFLRSVRRLLVAACVVPSSPIFVTRRFLQEPHGVTTQKTPFFIFICCSLDIPEFHYNLWIICLLNFYSVSYSLTG
jgi:hypothetical protein